jgi:hypothetical protein
MFTVPRISQMLEQAEQHIDFAVRTTDDADGAGKKEAQSMSRTSCNA